MIEQYKCPSWADDDGEVQDCRCGKCDLNENPTGPNYCTTCKHLHITTACMICKS